MSSLDCRASILPNWHRIRRVSGSCHTCPLLLIGFSLLFLDLVLVLSMGPAFYDGVKTNGYPGLEAKEWFPWEWWEEFGLKDGKKGTLFIDHFSSPDWLIGVEVHTAGLIWLGHRGSCWDFRLRIMLQKKAPQSMRPPQKFLILTCKIDSLWFSSLAKQCSKIVFFLYRIL